MLPLSRFHKFIVTRGSVIFLYICFWFFSHPYYLHQLGFGNPEVTPCLWVGHLPRQSTQDDLRAEFGVYGPIVRLEVNHRTHEALVLYEEKDIALRALESLKSKKVNCVNKRTFSHYILAYFGRELVWFSLGSHICIRNNAVVYCKKVQILLLLGHIHFRLYTIISSEWMCSSYIVL